MSTEVKDQTSYAQNWRNINGDNYSLLEQKSSEAENFAEIRVRVEKIKQLKSCQASM